MGAEPLPQTVVGDRGPAIPAHSHSGAFDRVAPDRLVDPAAPGQSADAHRFVFANDTPLGHRAYQFGMRRNARSDDHQAAGVLVEPVYDAGARQVNKVGPVMQQSILQRAVGVSGAGMNDQASRLVDHDDRFVREHHIESDCLRSWRHHGLDYRIDDDRIAAVDRFPRLAGSTIHGHLAGYDPGLDPAARVFRQQLRQRRVKPQTGQCVGNSQLMLTVGLHGDGRGSSLSGGDG